MVELEKSGRVFYAREGGRISELTFENTEKAQKRDPNWTKFVYHNVLAGHKRRLFHVDHQKENLLLRALPEWVKQYPTKRVLQLKLDQQRNILYSLGESETGWTRG